MVVTILQWAIDPCLVKRYSKSLDRAANSDVLGSKVVFMQKIWDTITDQVRGALVIVFVLVNNDFTQSCKVSMSQNWFEIRLISYVPLHRAGETWSFQHLQAIQSVESLDTWAHLQYSLDLCYIQCKCPCYPSSTHPLHLASPIPHKSWMHIFCWWLDTSLQGLSLFDI